MNFKTVVINTFLISCYDCWYTSMVIWRVMSSKSGCFVSIEQNSKWFQALSVPMHVGVFDRLFVSRNLMSKFWVSCSFTKVPDSPQTFPTSSGSKTKEPKQVCLSEAKASHFWNGVVLMWTNPSQGSKPCYKNLVSPGGRVWCRIKNPTL